MRYFATAGASLIKHCERFTKLISEFSVLRVEITSDL